jgi:hypothetical protein
LAREFVRLHHDDLSGLAARTVRCERGTSELFIRTLVPDR